MQAGLLVPREYKQKNAVINGGEDEGREVYSEQHYKKENVSHIHKTLARRAVTITAPLQFPINNLAKKPPQDH